MNQMLEMLYEQVKQKLLEEDLEPTAYPILESIKADLSEMLKEELTFDNLPAVEIKLEEFANQLEEIKCSTEN